MNKYTNQEHYSRVRMCTPCSKPHPPPNCNRRSRSRVVVTSYHVLIGSGTGAVHTHGPHIRMSVFHVHLCATSPSCSVTDPSVTQSYLTNDTFFAASHMICIHTLHVVPCRHLLNTHKPSVFSHQLEKLSCWHAKLLSWTSAAFHFKTHYHKIATNVPI